MPTFFINRPIFAWVIAIIISLLGIISITNLPVAQFPQVIPPRITIEVTYPGSSAQDIDMYVLSLIESEMTGLDGLDYTETKAEKNKGSIDLTFKVGTKEDSVQVEIANKLKTIETKLPDVVKKYGVTINKLSNNFLAVISFYNTKNSANTMDLSDFVSNNIITELKRIKGVGNAVMWASSKAMRIWLNPNKMRELNISSGEVILAIKQQNAQILGGELGDAPSKDSETRITVNIDANLKSVADFENINLKTNANGAIVKLKDVARIELGQETYTFNSSLNNKGAVNIGILLSNDGNAMQTIRLIKEKLNSLEKNFPEGAKYDIPFDSSKFVKASITKVVHTLLEAIFLVFIVILLFLQNIRYTFIPTIVVPVSLLGTFFILEVLGMSINMLSMFAMVLVIGIIVDDAIVVVENVARIMETEHLSPKQATIKAIKQIQGAVIGITIILISVFIPLGLLGGVAGNIYKQFTVVTCVSIAFSGFFALSFTPALCASFIKPIEKNKQREPKNKIQWFFSKIGNKFNEYQDKIYDKYNSRLGAILNKITRLSIIYVAIIIGAVFLIRLIPSGFLPIEDQGFLFVNYQLPPNSSANRTINILKKIDSEFLKNENIENIITIQGYSGMGLGENVATSFISLKDFGKRKDPFYKVMFQMYPIISKDKEVLGFIIPPPPIIGIGESSGYDFIIQNYGGMKYDDFVKYKYMILGMANGPKEIALTRSSDLNDSTQLVTTINKENLIRYHVDLDLLNAIMATNINYNYVNDFPLGNKLKKVIIQADPQFKNNLEDFKNLTITNKLGQEVPISTLISTSWKKMPNQIKRFNGYPAFYFTGSAAPGYSSGDAMNRIKNDVLSKLPNSIKYELTGTLREQEKAGNQIIYLYIFSIIAVFLCLAALYESWSVPFAVILVAPLGMFGMILATFLVSRIIPTIGKDLYFQISMITIIGLSCKNAILIVEFARELQHQGKALMESVLEAAHLRLRPIVMTSMAFILGVVPLIFASGASAASQREIGINVFFGMLIGTLLSIFYVPLFYLIVRKIFKVKLTEDELLAREKKKI